MVHRVDTRLPEHMVEMVVLVAEVVESTRMEIYTVLYTMVVVEVVIQVVLVD